MASNVRSLPVVPRRQAAARVRRARVAASLTQEQAAQRCKVGVRTLRDIELGRVRMVALEVLCELEQLAQDSQTRSGEATVDGRKSVAPLIRGDTEVPPAAPPCGVRASHQGAAALSGDVVRPTAGTPTKREAA